MATSLDMVQDVVWCDMCPNNQSPAELHCKPCDKNFCQSCVGKHLLSKKSITHDVVDYKLKETEPKYPECQAHLGRKCELQCQKCEVLVCVKCLADAHKGHIVADISALIDTKTAQIIQDNEELEKIIAPVYEKRDSELESKMSEESQRYDALISFIAQHRQDWYKTVDKFINKQTTDAQNDKRRDLGNLQNDQSEIRNTKSLIDQTIKENKKILNSNDITEIINYRSRNNEFKPIPPRTELSLPSFPPVQILRQFGTKSALIKSEVESYTKNLADQICGALSLSQHFYQSRIIATTDSDYSALYRVSCVGNDEVWISGHNKKLKHINIHGKILQEVTDVCRQSIHPQGLSITTNGALLFCDLEDRSVKMIRDKKIHTVTTLQDWVPCAVRSSSSGDILILMINDQENVKLVRYSGSVIKKEIQNDHNGQPLFYYYFTTVGRYIEENKNQDICVQNDDHIVVVNPFGQLQFRYEGKHPENKYTAFKPRGIATDSKCQFLVADRDNNCVHIIDKYGQFLYYIDNCDLKDPFAVSVDSQDRLWVGLVCGKIKVIKYMK